MAVSHADLAPSPRGTELGSKMGAFLMVFSVLLGLCCFILCLVAEATRSQMIRWVDESVERGDGDRYEYIYSDSGKTPLLCGAVAFVALAIAMVVEHGYILVAVTKSNPPPMAVFDHESGPAKALTWQAGFFFATTWICFAIAEILLLIGLSIESGHLTNWSTPRPSCLVIQRGLFSSGGVFGITTVFLACGLYVTALRAQKLLQDQEIMHSEILEVSTLYASPPRSLTTITNENPIVRPNQNEQELFEYLSALNKVF